LEFHDESGLIVVVVVVFELTAYQRTVNTKVLVLLVKLKRDESGWVQFEIELIASGSCKCGHD